MQNVDAVNKWRQELLAKTRTIGEEYGWVYNGRLLIITLAKTISSYSCERRIKHLLENADVARENQRFDPYYRQKSEFAEDLKSFFQNLSYVAERTANLVVEELKGEIPSQIQGIALS